MNFRDIVAETIAHHSLLDGSGRKIIVGLSGGADSVALLHILVSLGYDCIAANCNYHLRGEESDRDSRFAFDFAKKIGVEFVNIDFDVEKFISDNTSISIEEACRQLRYDWFEQLRDACDGQAVAVGHHADDSLETVLFNLQRGTGISGLTGISPINNRKVVRPLISLSREEILNYCVDNDLRYVTDSSNLTAEYSRNKLRNIVIPAFEENFRNLRKGVALTINHLSEEAALYFEMLNQKKENFTTVEGNINLIELCDLESNPSLILYEWFKPVGLSRRQADDIVRSRFASGNQFPTDLTIFTINRGQLISTPKDIVTTFSLADFRFERLPISEFNPVRDKMTACFSVDILRGSSPEVRSWNRGDRFHPFGMSGTKKVSDIFSDAKIATPDKERIPLLVKDDNILWITGIRQSDKLKIKPDDKEFVKVTYVGPQFF